MQSHAFAGVTFRLQLEHEISDQECFAPFLRTDDGPGWDIVYEATDRLPQLENPVYTDQEYNVYQRPTGEILYRYHDPMKQNLPYAVTEQNLAARTVRVSYLRGYEKFFSERQNAFFHSAWERLLLEDGRLILHAALVSTALGGILFSGVSGIGKSTQADLWCFCRNARVINGDRPVLWCRESVWMAGGAPFSGTSGIYRNEACPIRAIVMLGQASRCSLRRLTGAEAFRSVFEGITLNSGDASAISRGCDLVQQLTAAVPVYRLDCTPDPAAVDLLAAELEGVTGI